MKRSIIVGNWKMYATSIADAHVLATSIRNGVAKVPGVEVILCPPSLWLTEMALILKKNPTTMLGAQNMFHEIEGAFTGEISPLMLKEVVNYTIIGHSERREYFGETDFDVNEKVLAALKAKITPIICVGERRTKNKPEEPVKELKEALDHVPKSRLKDIIVAYEPVWAIGTGENAEPEYVARVISKLREIVSDSTPILYGGSVKSSNIKGYAERPEIDGVLVGGASVRSGEFITICKTWSDVKSIKK
ncbi:MAG: triose-phosphate isomerase [Patescibacteria group bacterium]|jgi:triosephosphate isomerase